MLGVLTRRCQGSHTTQRLGSLRQASTRVRAIQLNSIAEKGDDFEIPVVFIHGLFGCANNFKSIMKQCSKLSVAPTGLASMGSEMARPMYSLDLRNHGSSEHHAVMSHTAMSNDICRFLDEHDIDSAMLVGHGLGGTVAMTMAVQYGDRVERLMVVDPCITQQPHQEDMQGFLQAMVELDPTLITARTSANNMLEVAGVRDEAMRAFLLQNLIVNKEIASTWRLNLDAIAKEWHNISAFSLDNIATPAYEGHVEFVCGRKSECVNETTDCPELKMIFPNASFEFLDTGHWVHLQTPTDFIDIVMRFVARK